MKVFFDNNLSKHMAHAMRELSQFEAEQPTVIHLTDRFAPDTPDLVWIPDISKEGPWVVVSIDRFTKGHGAEREALRKAGHTVFVLDRQWSEHRFWLKAERLVTWWPLILEQARLVSAGAFRVPWKTTGRRRFEQIRL